MGHMDSPNVDLPNVVSAAMEDIQERQRHAEAAVALEQFCRIRLKAALQTRRAEADDKAQSRLIRKLLKTVKEFIEAEIQASIDKL